MFGHPDWHALEVLTEHPGRHRPSLPDRACAPDVVRSRFIYQCRSLAASFDLEYEEAEELVKQLRPTNAFRTAEEREREALLKLLFPVPWERVVPADALEDLGVSPGWIGSVGNAAIVVMHPADEADATNVGDIDPCDVLRSGGVRALSFGNLEEGRPLGVVAFLVEPTINQDVVTGLDLTIIDVNDLDGDALSEEVLVVLAYSLVLYLSGPALNAFSPLEITGSADGIFVRLHGHLDTQYAYDFVENLRKALYTCQESFEEFGHDDMEPDASNADMKRWDGLPVRAVEDSTISDIDDEEFDGSEDASGMSEYAEQVPKLLAEYLQEHDRADLATFAENHRVDGDRSEVMTFLTFVGACERSGAVPPELALTLRMLAIRMYAERMGREEGYEPPTEALERCQRDMLSAQALSEPEMFEYYDSTPPPQENADFRKGFALLVGMDLDALAALEGAVEGAGPRSEEEFLQFAATVLKRVLGREVDPEEFLRQMRTEGGINGVPRAEWRVCLEQLGWTVVGESEGDVKRFDPSFWSSTRDGGVEIPVIVEGYSHVPGDTTDEQANEAFQALADRYPKGCILLFRLLHFKTVDKRCYTCGGMFYRDGTWAPFALSQKMSGLDELLAQRKAGFTFENPLPEYEDPSARLAVSLNLLVQGVDCDEDSKPEVMVLRVNGWQLPIAHLAP